MFKLELQGGSQALPPLFYGSPDKSMAAPAGLLARRAAVRTGCPRQPSTSAPQPSSGRTASTRPRRCALSPDTERTHPRRPVRVPLHLGEHQLPRLELPRPWSRHVAGYTLRDARRCLVLLCGFPLGALTRGSNIDHQLFYINAAIYTKKKKVLIKK